MNRPHVPAAALGALLLALLPAASALGRGTPVVAVGGFSSQVSPGSARVGARVSVGPPSAGGSGARVGGAAPGPPAPPPPPTLPSDSPLLGNAAPAGPGSLWYEGPFGERCIYAPAASPLCYAIVAAAAPSLDVPAIAASLVGELSLSLAPIEASPSASRGGLSGARSWFWLASPPGEKELSLSLDGETVTVSARPGAVSWSFGDGMGLEGGAGVPFVQGSVPAAAVTHLYGTRCLPGDQGVDPYVLPGCGRGGYTVSASVSWTIAYRASGALSEDASLPGRASVSELVYRVSEVRSFLGAGPGMNAGTLSAALGLCVLAAGLLADLPVRVRARVAALSARGGAGWGRQAFAAAALASAFGVASWLALALPVVTLLAAAGGAGLPLLRRRATHAGEQRELERAWSAALDQLADGLEAGLGFPAAAAFVAASGPPPLRRRFGALVERVRRGELEQALEELAAAPEQAARTASALLRAALVELPTGGLAPLLRELARVGRERFESAERARGRALALRREATILALSPLCFLLLIGWSAPGYLDAYRSAAGTIVSLAGALAIGACYLAMLRLGRIPEPGRGGER